MQTRLPFWDCSRSTTSGWPAPSFRTLKPSSLMTGTATGSANWRCGTRRGFSRVWSRSRSGSRSATTSAIRAASGDVYDPYSFGPVLGPMDDYYMGEGSHLRLFDRLGGHEMEFEGIHGTHFAVWAPNAKRVSVVGPFNDWDGRRNPMRVRYDTGIWEVFIPVLGTDTLYKFEIVGADGQLVPLKADPFARQSELRPKTASVVPDPSAFRWTDDGYLDQRSKRDWRRSPMTIYEVHLGSWRRRADGNFMSYDQLAEQLVPYATDMGFTHLEFLPISEHPFDPSWGYQPTGLFAPTARFGDPAGFARFVDAAHAAGLGIILDWVPAHFPTDEFGLSHFDGTALYEHADPRQGFHPDWNTAIYNFRAQGSGLLPRQQRPLLVREVPRRRPTRRCRRIDALPRLFARDRAVDPQQVRRATRTSRRSSSSSGSTARSTGCTRAPS